MKRARRMIMVICVVSILIFAGSLTCRVDAKSLELLVMAETLMENRRSLADMYLGVYKLCLDHAGGKISASSMKSDVAAKTVEINSKLDSLKELSSDIMTRQQAATSDEMFAWGLAQGCVSQMTGACFSLMSVAVKIEGMGTGARFSEGWMRQYDVAGLNLNLASVRLDMASLMWDLLMAQP